ncbi:MAG: Flp pilus assembly complex ATPase component TadA [Armatimonadetes bacterium]|nr:Flp pilus assembly complex ATPase component TadA [Armatimonadota bacterium]
MVTGQRKRLGELLVEAGVITEAQLQEALARRQGASQRLGKVLEDMGLVTEAQICRAVAKQQGIEMIDLNDVIPESAALERIPAEIAIRHRVMPLRMDGSRLVLVMADPLDTQALDAAWRAARATSIERVTAPESEVLALIQEFHAGSQFSEQSLKNLIPTETVAILSDASVLHVGPAYKDFNATEALNAILGGAVSANATHVHIEPTGRTVLIRYRINGRLRRVTMLPSTTLTPLVGRLRSLFQVDPNQHAISQTGKARLQVGQQQVSLHLELVASIHGDRASVRVLDPRRFHLRISDLDFSDADHAAVLDLLAFPQGVVLVTGPEDADTSGTIYTFLNHLREEGLNLVSVEDPVAAILGGVTQMEVHTRMGVTWAETVRAAMRINPDVLAVGDIPDADTAAQVLRAAMGGQLVAAGVRAESAPAAIALLLDMGLEPYLIASALRGVIGQRVLRCICPDCKQPTDPDPQAMALLELEPADLEGKPVMRGRGCRRCAGEGYLGHTHVFEVARVRGVLRQQIARRAATVEIAEAAREVGMRRLRDAALEKVFAGITTLREVAAVVPTAE